MTSPKAESMRMSEVSHVPSIDMGLQKAASAGPAALRNTVLNLPSVSKKQSGMPPKK